MYKYLLLLLLLTTTSYSFILFNSSEAIKIKNKNINWGFSTKDKDRNIDIIVIHSTYNTLTADSFSVDGVLEQFRRAGVASHYLIAKDGEVIQIVNDNNIAYHAGKSILKADGRTNLNKYSIGIEVINTIHSSPTNEQYKSLAKLVSFLKNKYGVKYIVGHNDIASGRKTDPWNFDWQYFSNLEKEAEGL